MSKLHFSLIAAVDRNFGIGKSGKMPWHLPDDLEYFSRITTGNGNNAVIMGRTTWESLPAKHRPLPNRLNIALSTDAKYVFPNGVMRAGSFDEALAICQLSHTHEIFVIGGANVFAQAIKHPSCRKIYLTVLDAEFDCDTFFPRFDNLEFKEKNKTKGPANAPIPHDFVVYEK